METLFGSVLPSFLFPQTLLYLSLESEVPLRCDEKTSLKIYSTIFELLYDHHPVVHYFAWTFLNAGRTTRTFLSDIEDLSQRKEMLFKIYENIVRSTSLEEKDKANCIKIFFAIKLLLRGIVSKEEREKIVKSCSAASIVYDRNAVEGIRYLLTTEPFLRLLVSDALETNTRKLWEERRIVKTKPLAPEDPDLEHGDLICRYVSLGSITIPFVTHWGIYDATNHTVIEYTGNRDTGIARIKGQRQSVGGIMRNVLTETWAIVKLKQEICLDVAEVIERATSRLGEDKYNIFKNNCEHFALWAKTGMSFCGQLSTVSAAVGKTMISLSYANSAVAEVCEESSWIPGFVKYPFKQAAKVDYALWESPIFIWNTYNNRKNNK